MGMTLSSKGSGGRRGGRAAFRPMSDINVTPMVDVMLVLLVIFMVTAPLLTVGVQVDLPKTKASVIKGEDEPLAVSIDAKGNIHLQETEIPLEALVPRLQAIAGANPDIRIFVRGDKNIAYGRIMQVMGYINAGGFNKVGLVTERVEESTVKGAEKTAGPKRKGAN